MTHLMSHAQYTWSRSVFLDTLNMNFRATYEFKLHVAGVSTKYFSTNVHNDIFL